MPEAVAIWLVRFLTTYAVAGALFAAPFAISWVGRIDPLARDGTWGFRVLLLPGAALLWPFLAYRLIRRRGGLVDHNAHLDAARQKAEA